MEESIYSSWTLPWHTIFKKMADRKGHKSVPLWLIKTICTPNLVWLEGRKSNKKKSILASTPCCTLPCLTVQINWVRHKEWKTPYTWLRRTILPQSVEAQIRREVSSSHPSWAAASHRVPRNRFSIRPEAIFILIQRSHLYPSQCVLSERESTKQWRGLLATLLGLFLATYTQLRQIERVK